MSKLIRQISVFVSSPGGLTEERELVETVCKHITKDLGQHLEFVIEVLRWESHTRPAAGKSAQDTINKQMGLDYDIYLGMLGARFGTATELWGSGTEEEFELAYESWSKLTQPEIMFYFAENAPELSQIDPDDLKKRIEFQKKLKERGVLYHTFSSRSGFEIALRDHLIGVIHRLLRNHRDELPQKQAEESNLAPLAHWAKLLEEKPAVQVEDLLFAGTQRIKYATELLEKYTDRTSRIARSTNKIGRRIEAALSKGSQLEGLEAVNDLTSSMSRYSRFLIDFIVEFDEALSIGLSDFSRGFVVAREKMPEETGTFVELAATIDGARAGTEATLSSLAGLSQTFELHQEGFPALQNQRLILRTLTKDFSALLERSSETMKSLSADIRAAHS
ncbi:DUF4062 domain-containing protein [Pseudophaeobacter arcticus]|uniref:DUF4062 domain-containing protein n=1 Tax=Pseudophaeobacter arcticus TaxID=385492 RepID=UPI003A96AA7B